MTEVVGCWPAYLSGNTGGFSRALQDVSHLAHNLQGSKIWINSAAAL